MYPEARPPVIIVGMHRSGTSMVIRMLEALGLFVGERKDPNHEALFFQRINEWLLRQSGGTWDYPKGFHYLLENREVRVLAADYIRYLMKTPRVISFLGWRKYLRYHVPSNLDIPWGWKDPRNTYTLPLWLDLFPDAKIIHIYRHGVDVANSLKTRNDMVFAREKILYEKRKPFYFFIPKSGGFTDTIRCSSLEGGFSLWEEYLNEAKVNMHNIKCRAMQIKYEDFLAKPYEILKSLMSFCDITASDTDISEVIRQVKKDRAFAYRSNPELKAFADRVAERLRVFEY